MDLDGFDNTSGIGVGQEVRWYLDVVHILIDRFTHLDRRPIVLLFPLNLAAQRRGLLDDREHRHDAVKPQLCIAGGLARRAINSGTRLASGNGASTRSASFKVATEVGLHTGVRSTGSREAVKKLEFHDFQR